LAFPVKTLKRGSNIGISFAYAATSPEKKVNPFWNSSFNFLIIA
jgi:hypothetical protein